MAKPELVIFDCDGVLVDSERIAVRLNIEMLAEFGHHATETDIVDHFVGKSLPTIQEKIAEWLGRPVPEWPDLWMPRMTAAHDAELTAVDGIAEALDRIDLPVCVASSGRLEKTRHSLKLTGLSHHFGDRLFSSTMVERGKPFPDLFLHAARTLGVEPAACVVVEDSEPGVQAARSAGMRCFAYAGGVTSGEKLAGDGTVVFDDMRRLPELLAAS